MTPIQILTLTIAIVFPAVGIIGTVAALMYSNKRVDDLRGDLAGVEKRLKEHIDTAFSHIELLLKLHEAEHHKR